MRTMADVIGEGKGANSTMKSRIQCNGALGDANPSAKRTGYMLNVDYLAASGLPNRSDGMTARGVFPHRVTMSVPNQGSLT